MSEPVLVDWAVSRWWDDPYSRGGWSLLRVGGSPETRRALGRPINDRVIIAGEATHPEQAGMTHGAFEEGQRAARWCLDQGHRRVLVVGSGAAGLGAARLMADNGIEVIVLEARDRIGGRIHSVTLKGATAEDPGDPGDSDDSITVELGANWLQQGARNSLAPIAASAGLRLVDTDFGDSLDFGPIGVVSALRSDELSDELRRRMVSVDREVEGEDRSIASVISEWIERPEPWSAVEIAAVVDAEIYLDSGAPLDDLSARFGFEPGVGEGDLWIVGGYRQILDVLAADIDIRCDWPVGSVTVTDDSVTIAGSRGRIAAGAVIVTIPAAVLAAGALAFEPLLPRTHRDALAQLTVGRVEKVALRFDRRWWPASKSGYLRIFDDRPGCVAEFLDITEATGVPAIVGLFVGSWVADMWDDRSDAEIAESVCRLLALATSAAQ